MIAEAPSLSHVVMTLSSQAVAVAVLTPSSRANMMVMMPAWKACEEMMSFVMKILDSKAPALARGLVRDVACGSVCESC
jgi:hypothetical protein